MVLDYARPTRAARSPVGTLADPTARGKLIKRPGYLPLTGSSPGSDQQTSRFGLSNYDLAL